LHSHPLTLSRRWRGDWMGRCEHFFWEKDVNIWETRKGAPGFFL
jgi:hypothetical protein